MQDILLDDPVAFNQFERVVEARRPALIVLDAFRGLFRGDENSSRDVWFIKRIARLCRDLKVSTVLLQHVTKRRPDEPGGEIDLDRIRGSTALRQPCRSIIGIDEPNPDSDSKRVRILKLNLGPKPKPLGFRIGESSMVTFDGEAPARPHKETVVDRIIELLRNLLTHGPRKQSEIRDQVEAAGFSWVSARRAKEALGIVAVPKGREGSRGVDAWYWSLPAHDPGANVPPDGRAAASGERSASSESEDTDAFPIAAPEAPEEEVPWWDR